MHNGSQDSLQIIGLELSTSTSIEPGTRTYTISLTLSSVLYSGTKNDLYLRLCIDSTRTNCVQKCDDYICSIYINTQVYEKKYYIFHLY